MQELIQVDFELLSPDITRFIELELNKCRQYNITIYMPKQRSVLHQDISCAGYFESEELIFAVACGKSVKKWLNTFVHESCHLDQWAEGDPLWHTTINGQEPLILLDDWIANKIELDNITKTRIFDIVTEIELDCEKRSVEKIRKYNLPIKIDTYIRKSNAYVWGYRLVEQTRNWEFTSGYEVPEVWRNMPKHFDNCYDKLPSDVYNVFMRNQDLIIG